MEERDFIISGPTKELFIPKNKTLGEYFFECLRKRNKDEVINVNGLTGDVLTCGALLENAVKFIIILKNQGVQQGDVISICSENSIEYGIPILSAFAMGVTVNLLNANYTSGEIVYALKVVNPKVIICTETTLQNVELATSNFNTIKSILLMGSNLKVQNNLVTNLNTLLGNTVVNTESYQPEHFDSETQGSLIILSSGTTGLPKGVFITHESLKIYICNVCDARTAGLCGDSVVLALLPFFFIYGCFSLLASFVQPLKLVVLHKFKPDTFLKAIEVYKVTKLPISPPLVLFLAKSPLVKNYDLTSLEDVYSGGACLGSDISEEASKALGGIKIRQCYGLTEIGASTYVPHVSNKPTSIGVLAPNYKAKICDIESNKLLGPFKIGELCIKPSTHQPKYMQTSNTDVIDVQGFFHTGDLGYYDPEGYFYITGRIKDLIKYKGFQVSPSELENLLLQHSDIKDCAVIGIPNEQTGELPCAFIVCKACAQIKEQDVITYVAERISLQKRLHGGAVFINEIPRNASGKILRDKLYNMYKEMELTK